MGSQPSTTMAVQELLTTTPQLSSTMSPLLKLCLNQRQYYPIYESFMSHLETSDIVRLGRLSKELSNTYQDALKTQWSIHTHLKRFFADPTSFHNIQAATGALITKHIALGFFERRIIRSSEEGVDLAMCIVVEHGHNAETIEDFIMGEGYLKADNAESDNESDSGSEPRDVLEKHSIVQISSFTKCIGGQAGRRVKVTVEHCKSIPEHTFAKSMACTNMGHCIAWDKAYCLFPLALKNKVSYLTMKTPEGTEPWLNESRRELQDFSVDYSLKTAKSAEQFTNESRAYRELGPVRQFGDQFSWIIELDLQEIEPSKQQRSSLDLATFSMYIVERNAWAQPPQASFFTVNSRVLQTVALRQRYLLCLPSMAFELVPDTYSKGWSDEAKAFHARFKSVGPALVEVALLQFNMLDSAQRPANFEAVAKMEEEVSKESGFVVPSWWSYHDDEVHDFLSRLREYINSRSG